MSMVPNEIPTKCDLFILRKSKTSRISLAKAEKVYFCLKAVFNIAFDSPLLNYTKFGVDSRHFKGMVVKGNKKLPVIGYNLGDKIDTKNSGKKIEILYTPVLKYGKNDFFIELKLKDFKYN